MTRLTSLICVVFLSACSLTMPRDIGNDHKLELAPLNNVAHKKSGQGTLIVKQPQVTSELDTYRIALVNEGGAPDYFAGMRWADFLPVILQQSVVATLQQTGAYRVVASDETLSIGTHTLQLNVESFAAIYPTPSAIPSWQIRMRAKWIGADGVHVTKEARIESTSQATGTDRAALAEAIRAAYADALRQLVASRPR